jgi:hypothetical protein
VRTFLCIFSPLLCVHHPPFLLARMIASPIIIAAKNKTGHKTKYSGNRCHHVVDSLLATLLSSSSSVNGIVLLITSIKSRSRASSAVGGGGGGGGIGPSSIHGVSSQVSTTTAFAEGIASISTLSVGTATAGTTVPVCTATVVTPHGGGTEDICRPLCICCRHDMPNQMPSPFTMLDMHPRRSVDEESSNQRWW